METKIRECQTLRELSVLEGQSVLNEMGQRLVLERQIEIFQRIMQWRLENEQLGLAPDLTDTWTPVQRQIFLQDWQDDEIMLQPVHGQKRTYEEMTADDDNGLPVTQVGRGEKRSHEEIDDDDDSNAIPFVVESVKQVNVKKVQDNGYELPYPIYECVRRCGTF